MGRITEGRSSFLVLPNCFTEAPKSNTQEIIQHNQGSLKIFWNYLTNSFSVSGANFLYFFRKISHRHFLSKKGTPSLKNNALKNNTLILLSRHFDNLEAMPSLLFWRHFLKKLKPSVPLFRLRFLS